MTGMREALMRELLHSKDTGATTAELSEKLGISRNAVQQHLVALERDGMVEVKTSRRTPGRPGRAYALTDLGYEQFPRNYAFLAEGVLEMTRDALGDEAVDRILSGLAEKIVSQQGGLVSATDREARVRQVVAIMNDLGYDAAVAEDGPGIDASNCIYHRIARRTRAVCRFDVALLSGMLGEGVRHEECMLDGSRSCRFRLSGPSAEDPGTE